MPAWNHLRNWNDTLIASYFSWVANNYERFNADPVLCNWFPLRLLVEFAASQQLRIRLEYWPGRAPTGGGERHWNTSKILIHDAQSANFSSKFDFYRKVKSNVTARMIGMLNTDPITRADAQEGDLFLYDYSPTYWHAEVIVKATERELIMQSGSKPIISPRDHENRVTNGIPKRTYGNSPRRWQFSQFDQ